ncbi:super-infection exclusion protein B [Macrococcus capreoli]|uniref:super-infection exclusion protein B n=1 Tax=Macrococcus capreoli TaxID=2982690 RepID=UPI003F43B7E5
MGIANKILDIISKPINFSILIAIFLTSLLLFLSNFLSPDIILKLKIEEMQNKYNYIIAIVLIASFFLLIVQSTSMLYKKYEDNKAVTQYKKIQEELFKDSDALEILWYLYETHPQARELPYLNQKVKLLNQYGIIIPATSQWLTHAYSPSMPYVLQPIAEEKLQKMKN